MDALSRLHVQYLDSVIAKRRHEQPLALHVGAEMIDAPVDVGKGDPALRNLSLHDPSEEEQRCHSELHIPKITLVTEGFLSAPTSGPTQAILRFEQYNPIRRREMGILTTVAEAGKVGVWTKADSVTLFDDFGYGAQ